MASPQSRNSRSASVDRDRSAPSRRASPKNRARSHSVQRQGNDEVSESIAAMSAAQMVDAVVASASSSAARQRSGSNNSRGIDNSYGAPRRRSVSDDNNNNTYHTPRENPQKIVTDSHFRPRSNSHDAGAGRNPSLIDVNPNFRPRSNSHDAGSNPIMAAAAAVAMGNRVMEASQRYSSSRPPGSSSQNISDAPHSAAYALPKNRSVSAGKRTVSNSPAPKQRARSHDHGVGSGLGSQEQSNLPSTTLRSASAERHRDRDRRSSRGQPPGLERIISGVPLEATRPVIRGDNGDNPVIFEQDDFDQHDFDVITNSDKQSQRSFYSMEEGHGVQKTSMQTHDHPGDSAASGNQDAHSVGSHSGPSVESIGSKRSRAPSAASIEHIVNVEDEAGSRHPPATPLQGSAGNTGEVRQSPPLQRPPSEDSMVSAAAAPNEPEMFRIDTPMQRSSESAENENGEDRDLEGDANHQEPPSDVAAPATRDHHMVGAPMRKMHMSQASIGACIAVVVLILVCCIGIPLSLQNVPINNVAIKVNSHTKQVDYSQVYSEGRYFAPFTDFLLFPTVVSTMVEKVTARAKDGYPLTVRFGLQYYLDRDNIHELYKKYGRAYTEVFRRESRDIMMKTISKYGSSSFYQNREDIINDMFKEVCQKLLEKYALCWGLQFTEVGLAPALEQRLLRLELDRWYVFRKEGEQVISQVNSVTEVIQAEFQRDMSVTESNSSTNAKIITETGESEAKLIKRGVEAACNVTAREAEAVAARVEKQAGIDSWRIAADADRQAKIIEFKAIADKFSMVEEARSNALVIRATAEAEATRALKAATGAARHRLLLAQGRSMQVMSSLLGLSGAGLVKYETLTSTAKYNDSRILFGDYQDLHVSFLPGSEAATENPRRLYAAKSSQRVSALGPWRTRWSKMMSRMIAKTGYCDGNSCSFTNKKNEL